MVGVLAKGLFDLLAVVVQLRLQHPQLPGAREGQAAFGLREGLRGRKGQPLGEQVQPLLVSFRPGQLVGMQELISFPELFMTERSAFAQLGDARL
jgi:hypothetical protein